MVENFANDFGDGVFAWRASHVVLLFATAASVRQCSCLLSPSLLSACVAVSDFCPLGSPRVQRWPIWSALLLFVLYHWFCFDSRTSSLQRVNCLSYIPRLQPRESVFATLCRRVQPFNSEVRVESAWSLAAVFSVWRQRRHGEQGCSPSAITPFLQPKTRSRKYPQNNFV